MPFQYLRNPVMQARASCGSLTAVENLADDFMCERETSRLLRHFLNDSCSHSCINTVEEQFLWQTYKNFHNGQPELTPNDGRNREKTVAVRPKPGQAQCDDFVQAFGNTQITDRR